MNKTIKQQDMNTTQQAAIKRIKAEFMTNAYAFGNDFLLYLNSAWKPLQLEELFGTRRNLLLALGFSKEMLCMR